MRSVKKDMYGDPRLPVLLAVVLLCLTSCVGGPVDWGVPGAAPAPRYYGAPLVYPGYAPGIGYRHGYYGRSHYPHSRCHRCGHHPCRCHYNSRSYHHHARDHDCDQDHKLDPGERKYRILAGDLEGKKKPDNFHSLDWYHERGYSLSELKIETENGKVIDRRPSSKKKSKSGSKKKK